MNRLLSILFVALTLGASGGAQGPAADSEQHAARFGVVDVYIDSGRQAMAAYQFELKATAGNVQFVGIENGDAAGFQDPPYYDPAALAADSRRIIVGAFNLGEKLPSGKTRIARLHVRVGGGEKPVWDAKLVTAGGRDGSAIQGNIQVVDRTGEGEKR